MSIADTIATTINFAGLVFLGAQVMLARKGLSETAKAQEREWDRQRRKSTLDMIAATSQYRESLKAALPWNDRDPKEVATFLAQVGGDREKLVPVREFLNYYEDLAVGARQGVFDIETISMSEGSRIIATAENYRPYIENVRQEIGNPSLYENLEYLAEALKLPRQILMTDLGGGFTDKSVKESGLLTPKLGIKRILASLDWRRSGSLGTAPKPAEGSNPASTKVNDISKAVP